MTFTATNNDDDGIVLTASKQVLDTLKENISSFWCDGSIPILQEPPSSIDFLADFVASNRPCIIRNAIMDSDGKPLQMTLDQLVDLHPDLELQVDVTPDGHGDCIRRVRRRNGEIRHVFVQPQQQSMSMVEFRNRLRQNQDALSRLQTNNAGEADYTNRILDEATDEWCTNTSNPSSSAATGAPPVSSALSPAPGIVYYSRQNDCLRTELAPLMSHVPNTIHFAEQAIRTGPPDAINLWIGNECSVSSFHKDPYENMFYVLEGTKVFYLCPPANALVLKQAEYSNATFVSDRQGDWLVQIDNDLDDSSRVRWIGLDPTRVDHVAAHSLLSHCHAFEVKVQAGEMLYLPSLWFHKVTQTCETLAVNYWYDMQFDAKWCYFEFLQAMEG